MGRGAGRDAVVDYSGPPEPPPRPDAKDEWVTALHKCRVEEAQRTQKGGGLGPLCSLHWRTVEQSCVGDRIDGTATPSVLWREAYC